MKRDIAAFQYTFTSPVVMGHPTLFTPKAFKGPDGKEKGEPKYGATFVFDPAGDELKNFKRKAAECARMEWPGCDLAKIVWPWQSGDEAADRRDAKNKLAGRAPDGDWMRGKSLVKATSKFPVVLAIFENGRIVTLEDEISLKRAEPKFFFGAEVLAQVTLNPFQPSLPGSAPMVTCYLNQVLATGKGTKIGGAKKSAAQVFSGYAGVASEVNPLGEEVDIGAL